MHSVKLMNKVISICVHQNIYTDDISSTGDETSASRLVSTENTKLDSIFNELDDGDQPNPSLAFAFVYHTE